jgi:hypothetical protein
LGVQPERPDRPPRTEGTTIEATPARADAAGGPAEIAVPGEPETRPRSAPPGAQVAAEPRSAPTESTAQPPIEAAAAREPLSPAEAPAAPRPTAETVTRRLVELLPRPAVEPQPTSTGPSREAAPTARQEPETHVEVRIGRIEVRRPRSPEPARPPAAAAVPPRADDPFAALAAARRYVDRTWSRP